MVNKTDILSAHPQTQFQELSASTIYIADFTRRTQGTTHQRSVEVSDHTPTMDDGTSVDAIVFHNTTRLQVEFSIFDDYHFEDITNTNIEHCEGGMYAKESPKWVTFFEIKDCEERNILNYKQKAIGQITNVLNDFKTRGIIHDERVYGVISFPRKHTAFNDVIFGDMIEYTRLRRTTGILFYATNEVFIVNANGISIER